MIYFMRAGQDGPIKIGWSKNPAVRMRAIKPTPDIVLCIIRLVDAPRWVEHWFHQRFIRERIGGQWFKFNPAMLVVDPPNERPTDRGPTWGRERSISRIYEVQEIEFQNDIPIPGRPPYEFAEMEVGHSFARSAEETASLKSAASRYKREHPGWDYKTATDGRSIRLWCRAVPKQEGTRE